MIARLTLKTVLALSLSTSVLYAQERTVTLDEAIAIALENNNQLKVSATAVKIAAAQYEQAMSAHYPSLDLSVSAMRLDQAPTFEMRGTAQISDAFAQEQLLGTAGFIDSVHNANLDPLAPTATQVAEGAIAAGGVTGQSMPIEMDVKLAGRDTVISQLELVLPLYTGGKISAITKQASIGKMIAQEGRKRSVNKVIYDVRRYYYGVQLTKQLKQLSEDTLSRMGFIRDLTSELYKGGSMRVKKTDYLRSKLSVNLIESLYESIASKEILARSALVNAMGVSWKDEVQIAAGEFKTPQMSKNMDLLVEDAYRYNPDYKTLKLAIDIHEAKIDEAKSEYLPSLAVMGSVQNIYNDYEYGIVNKTNENSWSIGVGLSWSLFNGMRTSNKVEQSRLEKLKLQQQEVLLEEGLALQVKQVFLDMQRSYKQYSILVEAVQTAKENRDLNTRAYQEDMVETKDVIEAQLFEAFTTADFYRAQHDHALGLAKADYIVGSAVENSVN